jgi:adenylylsulfate kinase
MNFRVFLKFNIMSLRCIFYFLNMTFVLWMTGLPCSGKTTIIRKLQETIPNLAVLDGDELREWLSPKDFTKEGRDEHNKKVAHLAKLLLKHKVSVGVSLVSPYIENRKNAREIIDAGDKFSEVYVKCSLEKCEERDVKGMYKKARAGEIKNFTGLDAPYEEPENPDLVVDTDKQTLEQSVQTIKRYLQNKNLF